MEVVEALIEFAGDVGDEEEDGADGGPSASDGSVAVPFAAVISHRSKAGEFSDGLVGQGSDLGEVGEDDGDATVGDAFDRSQCTVEGVP